MVRVLEEVGGKELMLGRGLNFNIPTLTATAFVTGHSSENGSYYYSFFMTF